MIEAAKNYAMKCKKNNTEERYIKSGKTFLSDTTPFLDYVNKQQNENDKSTDGSINPFSDYLE